MEILRLSNKTKYNNILILLLAFIVLLFLPKIIKPNYWFHLINIAFIYIILSLGLNIITGFTGMLSIGHAGFFGIGAYTSALLAIRLDLPFWITIVVATIFCGFVGLLLSLPCLKLSGIYLAIVTIGFGQIVYTILMEWRDVTKGAMGLTGVPAPSIGAFVFDKQRVYYYLILIALIILIYVAKRIENSSIGRSMKSIRDDQIAAEACGIDSENTKKLAFVISAVYAGIAGSLYAHYMQFISPDSFSADFSQMILMMVIIGGKGSIPGSIAGGIIIALLPELLRDFKSYQMIVYGTMLILSMLFLPNGIIQLVNNILSKVKARYLALNKG